MSQVTEHDVPQRTQRPHGQASVSSHSFSANAECQAIICSKTVVQFAEDLSNWFENQTVVIAQAPGSLEWWMKFVLTCQVRAKERNDFRWSACPCYIKSLKSWLFWIQARISQLIMGSNLSWKQLKDLRSVTSASSNSVHPERRRGAHKSSLLALRSPDDSSRPAADVNQTSCSEMKKPVKQLQPSRPLVTLPLWCSGINSKSILNEGQGKQVRNKRKRPSPVGGCAEAECMLEGRLVWESSTRYLENTFPDIFSLQLRVRHQG